MSVRVRQLAASALAVVTAAAALVGCSSSDPNSDRVGTSSLHTAGTRHSSQPRISDSVLATSLDLVPDMPSGYVTYTNWSAFGHRSQPGANNASFAGGSVDNDSLHKDLGIRTTDAEWEVDVAQTKRPPLVVLGFGAHTDLSSLAGKLSRLGYHANGSLFTGAVNAKRMWTLGLPNIGIDANRHLLVGGRDVNAIRSVLAGPVNSLGRASAVAPLLAVASGKLDRVATAFISVGSMACVRLSDLLRGRATPQLLDALRRQFPGTFDPPQAEIMAVANPTATTALDALTFPSQDTAQANKESRSAAVSAFNALDGRTNELALTSSSVIGRVLTFSLGTSHSDDFRQRFVEQTLGVDVCP